MLKKTLITLVFAMGFSHGADAKGGGFGLNLGLGIPFLTQVGLNYQFSDTFGLSASYNQLSLDSGEASVDLTMPEVLVHYHPFAGSFFVAAGVGQETLEVKATESLGSTEIKIDVDAMTTVLKLGWMWGSADGGFWYGIDVSYISPSSPETTISAPGVPTSDPNYIDAQEAANDFGETAYPNMTLARFGWLF